MPHLHRFHIAPLEDGPIKDVVLTSGEAHHASHVVRVKERDTVVLFDGQGRELSGQVSALARHEVQVAIEKDRRVPEPSPKVALAQAWLHRDKDIEYLIRHCTELGVDTFYFFRARRSERKPRYNEKWERIAIEVCKQSGRLWLPKFTVVEDLAGVLCRTSSRVLLAAKHDEPVPLASALQCMTGTDDALGDLLVLVGPEGDFTDEEVESALNAGAMPVSLGESTFRSEVAATLLASLLRYHLGRLGPRV